MRWSRLLLGDEEPGLRLRPLKPGQARGPKRLVPWWVRAERRVNAASVTRRLSKISRNGGGRRKLRAAPRPYGRRSVVKTSFRRNGHKGGWVRHARYLTREHAQREQERGLGFNGVGNEIDMVGVVREWERNDPLIWSMIISPEDGERIDLRQHARDLVAGMERDLGTRLSPSIVTRPWPLHPTKSRRRAPSRS